MGPGGLRFRELREDDLPRLHSWLNEPHVVASYGLGRRPTLDDVVTAYGPKVRREVPTRAFVAEIDREPGGYVQTYRILDHPAYAAQIGVEDESHGLDLFLGEHRLVGHGLGPLVVRRFVEEQVFGRTQAVAVVVDPLSTNLRAVRAFEKAGFRVWRNGVPGTPGNGDLLLRLDRAVEGRVA